MFSDDKGLRGRGALTQLALSLERTVVTCSSPLRRRPEATELVGDLAEGPRHEVGDTAHAVSERLRSDDTFGQFVRFVLVGGSSTGVYALLFLALGWLGYLPAHVIATVASSVLANEMHRRLTFRAEERVGWVTAQIEAGGVSLFGLVATSVALGWLNASVGSAPPVLQITLVAAVTGFIGLIRFVALRWLFRPTGALAAQ
jgi:putative flippase GtrA